MTALALSAILAVSPTAPETWFHVIGGNASKEGLAADIAAIADAGISGIQFFRKSVKSCCRWDRFSGFTSSIDFEWTYA